MTKITKILIVGTGFALVLSAPSLASSGMCNLPERNFGMLMDALAEKHRRDYIDFVLGTRQERFREDCHKKNVLVYFHNKIMAGQNVRFNRYNLKYYIGYFMMDYYQFGLYDEPIPGLAIDIASRTFDKHLFRDIEHFYKSEPLSLENVRLISQPVI